MNFLLHAYYKMATWVVICLQPSVPTMVTIHISCLWHLHNNSTDTCSQLANILLAQEQKTVPENAFMHLGCTVHWILCGRFKRCLQKAQKVIKWCPYDNLPRLTTVKFIKFLLFPCTKIRVVDNTIVNTITDVLYFPPLPPSTRLPIVPAFITLLSVSRYYAYVFFS